MMVDPGFSKVEVGQYESPDVKRLRGAGANEIGTSSRLAIGVLKRSVQSSGDRITNFIRVSLDKLRTAIETEPRQSGRYSSCWIRCLWFKFNAGKPRTNPPFHFPRWVCQTLPFHSKKGNNTRHKKPTVPLLMFILPVSCSWVPCFS